VQESRDKPGISPTPTLLVEKGNIPKGKINNKNYSSVLNTVRI
jgi:hypothetical protein